LLLSLSSTTGDVALLESIANASKLAEDPNAGGAYKLSLENGRLETSSSCDWGLELGDLSASPGSTCHHQKEHIPSLPSGYYYYYYYYY
jgi:hypothetical protein